MNNVNGQPYFIEERSRLRRSRRPANAPPPTRYDIIEQEAAIILPTLAVAYSITPNLDVGVRGLRRHRAAQVDRRRVGPAATTRSDIKQDGIVHARRERRSSRPAASARRTGRRPNIELGANYTLPINIHAKGDAISANGPDVTLGGAPVAIVAAVRHGRAARRAAPRPSSRRASMSSCR